MPSVAESRLSVRADFPIFERRSGEAPLVYLDSGATSQKPRAVIDALAGHLAEHNANIHRGVYPLAQEADAAFDSARSRIAAFTGADPETTIFTKNATEAINLVARSYGAANLDSGDAVLITQMEHHANLVPWQQICRERGARAPLPGGRRARRALARAARRRARPGRRQDRRLRARLERARHDQPGRGDRRAGARRRSRDARRRRAGGSSDAGGDRRAGRGLLRLDGPQGASAQPGSASCTAAASCSRRWIRS